MSVVKALATLLLLSACSSPDGAQADAIAKGEPRRPMRIEVSVLQERVNVPREAELDVSTFNIPVLPDTMSLRIAYDCDPEYLEFLRQEPAEGEGSMMQHLFFRARKAGRTELRVRLVDGEGHVDQQARLTVTIEP